MGDRILPSNVNAERSVLGAAIIDSSCVPELMSVLSEADFQLGVHRTIWKTICEMQVAGQTIDTVTVLGALKDRMDSPPTWDFLTDLVRSNPSVANALRHAEMVKEAAALRALILATTEATDAAFGMQNSAEVRAQLQKRLEGIAPVSSQWTDISEVGPAARERKEAEVGFNIGLRDLQYATGGLYEGLNAVSGMPGAGKTTLCLQVVNRAILAGHLAAIVSADQAREDLFIAQWCNLAKTDELRVRGEQGAQPYKRLIESHTAYYEGRFDLTSIIAGLRVLAMRGYRWVLVDYLGLIQVPGTRPAEGAEVAAKALKLLSRELHLTMLVVISFTKPEDPDSPQMQEARGTMEVAHAVEQMWLMQAAKEPTAETFVHIVKSRHAGKGRVPLDLRGAQHRFCDWGSDSNA